MLAGTGIRTYACPMVQSAHWYTSNGKDHLYEWYEEKGFENLERSLEIIDAAIAHPSGRLHGMVGPGPGRHVHGRDVPALQGGR